MKVKELLAQLEAYNGEEELIVAYWDKSSIEDQNYNHEENELLTLTDEQWGQVVKRYQDGEWVFQSSASELFTDLIDEVLTEGSEG